jgi:hypothetical protein
VSESPEAVTLNEALCPAVTVTEVGCVVMAGAVTVVVELVLDESPPPHPANHSGPTQSKT